MNAYYNRPEHLDASVEFLATESFHLFVSGRWVYTYRLAENLLQAYREFECQGQACTVVTAGEIVFYCRRADQDPELEENLAWLARAKAQLARDKQWLVEFRARLHPGPTPESEAIR